MARHDREDPHSLEDQLAWLDAIKEMPDEVEIAVSAVTSATVASPPPSSADPEPVSPYPADPWSLVPAEPASGGLIRGAADSATGSAYGAPRQEDEETAEASEASSTSPIRESLFGGDSGYSGGFGYESVEKSEFGSGYGADSGYGESAFGDTTAFVTRPGSSPADEREDAPPVESSGAFGLPPETSLRGGALGESTETTTRGGAFGEHPETSRRGGAFGDPGETAARGDAFGEHAETSGRGTAFGDPGETSGRGTAFGEPAEMSASSTGPVSPPSSEPSFGAASESSFAPSFGASFGAASEPSATSTGMTPESPSGDQEPEDDGRPTSSQGGLDGSSSFTTPLFGERAFGAFSGSPADTDGYNVGAFSDSETRKPFSSSEPGTPSASQEPLRGWLEPAVPVPAAQQEPATAAEPEEQPAPPEIPSPFAAPRAEAPPDIKDDRFTGSLREDLAAEERKPYEPGPVAAPAPAPARSPMPEPAPERTPSLAPEQALVTERDAPAERDAVAEREAYQSPRRPAPPAHAFASPARTTGSKAAGPKAAGSKPTADSLDPVTLLRGRRNVPATGWRRLVYKASAGLIKPGEAPEVRRRRELVQRARTPVATGHHRVAVLSLKGGVGKTTTTVGLGATLAQVRGDRVIAVDANPDRGTLSDKVELETAATVRDLLNERAQIKRYVDIRAFTSQTPSRLEILASDRDPSVSEAFSAKDYHAVAQVLENFYSICITDCGTGLLHSAMSGVLGMADQIVLVSSPSVDGARAASATLDWLEAHHYGDLVRAATVVLCSVRQRSKSTVDLDKLEAHFAARCRTVVRVPYDAHLEEGAEIDLDRLQQATRDAYLRLAASVGDGFAGPQALTERRFSEIPDHL
ncbi:AAA family ATPase [Microbispora sp. CA-135349]|uniref:MinD/ParA family ATP-binding protein n=1 Tax=Microbispora sp. CA-135349 TaxID=3239953 RepID=UPI003D8C5853